MNVVLLVSSVSVSSGACRWRGFSPNAAARHLDYLLHPRFQVFFFKKLCISIFSRSKQVARVRWAHFFSLFLNCVNLFLYIFRSWCSFFVLTFLLRTLLSQFLNSALFFNFCRRRCTFYMWVVLSPFFRIFKFWYTFFFRLSVPNTFWNFCSLFSSRCRAKYSWRPTWRIGALFVKSAATYDFQKKAPKYRHRF